MNSSNSKTTKSRSIQGSSWGKVTSQRGTRSSYVTPNKNPARNHPQNSTTKITRKSFENHQKEKQERQHKALRNHTESFIHTMKVHTRSSLAPGHPSLFLDITWSSQASSRKTREKTNENDKGKWAQVPRVGCHPSLLVFIRGQPKD
jgi:hypothetical protein